MNKFLFLLLGIIFLFSCVQPQGMTPSEKRSFIMQMHQQTLNELYSKKPLAKDQMQNAAGYAVFSNIDTMVLFLGAGGGYGVAVDNSDNKKTYMKMAQASAGVGVGVKDFREVIIFNNRQAFRNFIVHGWDLGAEASAGAKSGKKGGETGAADSLVADVVVYKLTEAGVELRTNFSGKKYWLNDELNYY